MSKAKHEREKAEKRNKAAIYAAYGIEYKAGKIKAPLYGFINPLLVNGNTKLGDGVFTFSMLPGDFTHTVNFDGEMVEIKGTCSCTCRDAKTGKINCYACTGNYRFNSVKKSLAIKTVLARSFMDFVKRAILAQIDADGVTLLRIHAAGDFFNDDYINTWHEIGAARPACVIWSYTKNDDAESAFDDLPNVNIVKSKIRGYGFNFGKCGYIIRVYNALIAMGKNVYICRCGIDDNQHCTTCRGCSKNEYVLFIEHSTEYKARDDKDFPALAAIIAAQDISIAQAAD